MVSRAAVSHGTESIVIRNGVQKGARRARFVVGLVAGVLASVFSAVPVEARSLSFEERVAAQRAIEQVYWSHRIWPKENSAPKPALSGVLPDRAIRARVEDYLKKSNALATYWQRPITAVWTGTEMIVWGGGDFNMYCY